MLENIRCKLFTVVDLFNVLILFRYFYSSCSAAIRHEICVAIDGPHLGFHIFFCEVLGNIAVLVYGFIAL